MGRVGHPITEFPRASLVSGAGLAVALLCTASCSVEPDSCASARDGECDEPTYCAVGTDTTDCDETEAPTCVPQCGGRLCGLDAVCGRSCGICEAPASCDVATGQCGGVCVPNCAAVTCGLEPVCGSSCGPCQAPGTPIQSFFTTGIEGWTLEGYDTDVVGWSLSDFTADVVTHAPADGNPGGALHRHEEIYGRTEYFTAPPRYLGDLSDYHGGTLSFELRQLEPGVNPFVGPLVMVHGSATLWSSMTRSPA